MHGLYDIPRERFFTTSSKTTTGHSLKLYKGRSRLNVRKFFFSQRTISEWNSLSEEVISSGSVNEFKNKIDPLFKARQSNTISQRRLPAPLSTASDCVVQPCHWVRYITGTYVFVFAKDLDQVFKLRHSLISNFVLNFTYELEKSKD